MRTSVNVHQAKTGHRGLVSALILATLASPSTAVAALAWEVPRSIEEPALAHYVSAEGGWSISYPLPSSTYPAGWTVDDTDPSFVKIGSGPFLLGVHVGPAPPGSTLISLTNAVLVGMVDSFRQRNLEASVLTVGMLTLTNDLEATDTLLGHGGGRSRVVVALTDDRVFLINGETLESLWPLVEPDFDTIIRSFAVAAS